MDAHQRVVGLMPDFLLELRCEEIPARMQLKASEDLARLFAERLAEAGLAPERITSHVTPRRLALIAHGLPLETDAVSEEFKGPRTSAPDQALDGFLRKTGLSKDQLEDRGGVWFAIVEKPGRATADVLAEAVPAIVRAFPWPKSMRWGDASSSTESLRWVRPLQGIVAIFGTDVVDMEVDGVRSGRETRGHRFHASGPVTIATADSYADDLRAAHVIVSHEERQAIIAEKAAALAAARGYALIEDKGLVTENAGLTEWPIPLLGDFDPAFLEVSPEVIQLTLRVNQKYFVLRDADGKLAPAFICTANIEAKDGGAAIVAGNGKVLAARLSDARFFWEQDRRTPLAEHARKLERITFHEKLGTVADKVERVAKLAEWLATQGIVPGCDPALARQAAELCKADLVTEMVGEFPELQGLMGGYYAHAEGLPDEVADAIRDHYRPVGQGDEVPTAPVTVAVSLADKLDTLGRFFAIGQYPTGSKDPFALRRAGLGIIAIIERNLIRVSVQRLVRSVIGQPQAEIEYPKILDFLADRLKVQQREAGVRHDLIDAVFALGGEDDLVRLLARVKALQGFVETEEGANLLAGYRRAANILKKEGFEGNAEPAAPVSVISDLGEEDSGAAITDSDVAAAIRAHEANVPLPASASYQLEPAEAALASALDTAEPAVDAAIDAEDFAAAMAALAALRAPIDAIFESVTVNDADPAKRHSRLTQLTRIRAAMHKVADFSRIEG